MTKILCLPPCSEPNPSFLSQRRGRAPFATNIDDPTYQVSSTHRAMTTPRPSNVSALAIHRYYHKTNLCQRKRRKQNVEGQSECYRKDKMHLKGPRQMKYHDTTSSSQPDYTCYLRQILRRLRHFYVNMDQTNRSRPSVFKAQLKASAAWSVHSNSQ